MKELVYYSALHDSIITVDNHLVRRWGFETFMSSLAVVNMILIRGNYEFICEL